MRLEHAALQVPDPVAMADWYVQHMGCALVRSGEPPINMRFIAAGPVLIELYHSPRAPTPDYHSIHPVQLHLAFLSGDLKTDRDRLLRAGAKIADDLATTPAGDEILMLRDPWGVGLQLVKRGKPMLD